MSSLEKNKKNTQDVGRSAAPDNKTHRHSGKSVMTSAHSPQLIENSLYIR